MYLSRSIRSDQDTTEFLKRIENQTDWRQIVLIYREIANGLPTSSRFVEFKCVVFRKEHKTLG